MSILSRLFGSAIRLPPSQPVPVRPSRPPIRTLSGRPLVPVQRNSQRLHEERGWKRRGSAMDGSFRTKFGSYRGRIENPDSASRKFYISNPPQKVLSGPHGACFQPRGPNEFFIHWSVPPKDLDTGILRVEHTIVEALT